MVGRGRTYSINVHLPHPPTPSSQQDHTEPTLVHTLRYDMRKPRHTIHNIHMYVHRNHKPLARQEYGRGKVPAPMALTPRQDWWRRLGACTAPWPRLACDQGRGSGQQGHTRGLHKKRPPPPAKHSYQTTSMNGCNLNSGSLAAYPQYIHICSCSPSRIGHRRSKICPRP